MTGHWKHHVNASRINLIFIKEISKNWLQRDDIAQNIVNRTHKYLEDYGNPMWEK